MIHSILHDQFHLFIGDPGKLVAPSAGGAGLAGMDLLNWPVAEGECNNRLRFPGDLPTNGIDAHGPDLREIILAHTNSQHAEPRWNFLSATGPGAQRVRIGGAQNKKPVERRCMGIHWLLQMCSHTRGHSDPSLNCTC